MKKLNQSQSKYQDLSNQKEHLLKQLQEIIELSEGKDNPEVAKKITELEKKKLETDQRIETLKTDTKEFEAVSSDLNKQIQNASGKGTQKILDAIKKQRWFYFKDKPKVIFDKTTAYLWPNIEYWVFELKSSDAAMPSKSFEIDGFKGWDFPCDDDLEKIRDYVKIKHSSWIWVCRNANYNAIYHIGDRSKNTSSINICFYYKSAILSLKENSNDFFNNTKPENTIYTDNEKAQMVLDIFVNNKLRPLFDEEGITELYNKLYFEKEELVKQIQEVEDEIAKLPKPKTNIADFIELQDLLSGFDLNQINHSKVQYCMALNEWFLLLLSKMDEFKSLYTELLSKADQFEERLKDSIQHGDHEIVINRQKFLMDKMDFGLENLISDLLSLKQEALTLKTDLEECNTLEKLKAFENKSLPDFYFVAEKTANMIAEQLRRIDNFKENEEHYTHIAEIHEQWRDCLREFLKVNKDYFKKLCKKNSIDEELCEKWYKDWSEERLSVEKHVEPLIKASLDGILPFEILYKISDAMSNLIKDEYGKFYFEKLIPIYQKFAFNHETGSLHISLEKETEMQNILSNFRKSIEDIIFSVESNEGRLFIVRWAQDWFLDQIAQLIVYFEDKEMSDLIAKETLEDMRKLQKINLEAYLTDSKAYADEVQKYHEDFNALVFKMRKEADKSSTDKKTKKK